MIQATLRRGAIVAAGLAALCLIPWPGHGQSTAPDEAKAKAEGPLVFYTSNRTTIAEKHAKGFEQKYGIKVQIFRSGSEKVIAKLEAEALAGRIQADVLNVSDPGYFFAAQGKGTLLPYASKHAATIPDAFRDKDGHWAAVRLTAMTIAYNTKLVPAADAPKRWADLTDPRWQGKLTIASPSYGGTSLNWAAGILKLYGWKFFEDLAKQKPLLTEGHLPGMQLVASGERPVSAEMNDYDARAGIAKGQPIAVVLPEEGTFVIPTPIAILKATARPNAAKLFLDYMLSDEAQAVFVEDHTYSARTDVKPPKGALPLKDLKVIPMDWAAVEKQSEEIKTKFVSIVGK
ncbi:MAG: ABC transporter substrate-binding protein [Candidatus Rokuibacteriota bacterium]